MHINTKVVFEWDQDKQEYSEVYSEGYEYSGDLELAQRGLYTSDYGLGEHYQNQEEIIEGNRRRQQRPPPTGYQGYQSLWDLSQRGGLAGYLESEFDIGTGYEQYITPFENKPFEFLKAGLGLEQEALGYETTTGLREAGGAADTAYRQSNMANVGGITQALNLQKEKLMKAFKQSQEKLQLGYETDVYDEQQAQEETDHLRDGGDFRQIHVTTIYNQGNV